MKRSFFDIYWNQFSFFFSKVDNLHYEKFADGTVGEVEVPFDFPDWWNVQRFSSLISLVRGSSPRPIRNYITDSDSGVNWIKIGDTEKDGKYIESTAEKITIEGSKKSRAVFSGEFLLSNSMSFGRPYILRIDGFIHDGWFALRGFETAYNSDFLYLLTSSKIIMGQFLTNATGSTVKNISSDIVNITFMPLPPIEEQKRIVAVANELMAIVDKIESEQKDLQNLSVQLKKRVLDIAMQGKLVPQDPNDEPASVLLEKIRAEKQRLFEEGKLKKKDLEEITPVNAEDNAYYEKLPESWNLVALGNLYTITSSKRVMKNEWTESGVSFYRAREIVAIKKRLALKEPIFISKETYDKKINVSGEPSTNDILVTGVGTLGITYVVPKQHEKFYFKDGNVVWLKYLGNMNSKFIEKVIESPKMVKTINDTSGTTVGTLTIDKAKTLLIPIPPIEEQNRIVLTIDKLSDLLIQSIY